MSLATDNEKRGGYGKRRLHFGCASNSGGGSVLVLFFGIDPLPTWLQVRIILGGASGAAALTFLAVYRAMEFVITDHRVLLRRGLILGVFVKISQMKLKEIAKINAEAEAEEGRPFQLISADGRSLTVSAIADLSRLRRALVRETGLPDPVSG